MHSRITTALFAATALMLAGCTSEPETTLEPGQKAFVFESGVVPIGDFDPSSIAKEDLFDPCNEISDEEFARAGFTGEKLSSTKGEIESPHGTSVCTFESSDSELFILANVHANREMTEQMRKVIGVENSTMLPEVYYYQNELRTRGARECIAQIDTTKGAISTIFYSAYKNVSEEEMCMRSRKLMEALYSVKN